MEERAPSGVPRREPSGAGRWGSGALGEAGGEKWVAIRPGGGARRWRPLARAHDAASAQVACVENSTRPLTPLDEIMKRYASEAEKRLDSGLVRPAGARAPAELSPARSSLVPTLMPASWRQASAAPLKSPSERILGESFAPYRVTSPVDDLLAEPEPPRAGEQSARRAVDVAQGSERGLVSAGEQRF